MDIKNQKWKGLTGNQLKMIALLAMTCDHAGRQLLPQYPILKIIGRLAFPIFAYMIAEGCCYTKDKKKYIGTIASLAFCCQLAYYMAMQSLYQCVLVTFSLSIILIYVVEYARGQGAFYTWASAGMCAAAVYAVSVWVPAAAVGTDFAVDYGFWGILLPVFVYLGNTKWKKILFLLAGLLLLAAEMGGIQWYSLGAIPLLALYTGKRGKKNLKNLFYIYYPLHLAAIYAISLLL